ncbi:hypothetical protein [Amycolatopsis magusensis]
MAHSTMRQPNSYSAKAPPSSQVMASRIKEIAKLMLYIRARSYISGS